MYKGSNNIIKVLLYKGIKGNKKEMNKIIQEDKEKLQRRRHQTLSIEDWIENQRSNGEK